MKFKRELTRTMLLQLLADGYTQTQIAEMYGLAQAQISRMKNGKTNRLKVKRKPYAFDVLLARLWGRED